MDEAEIYKDLHEWNAYYRRHYGGFFETMFMNVDEGMDDETLRTSLLKVASFFCMDAPDVHNWCDTLARVKIKNKGEEVYELYYNLNLLIDNGINNKDALTLCLVHEMAHFYFRNVQFCLCNNEYWSHELAADFMVGAYSGINGLASVKYKYVISQTPMTFTHPKGELRAAATEYARFSVWCNNHFSLDYALLRFPAFMLENQKQLNEDFRQLISNNINEK